jgi:hypothetical protein
MAVWSSPYFWASLGIVLLALGVWLFPKPASKVLDVAFYQKYDPRSLSALLFLVLAVAAFALAIFPPGQ